MDWNDHFGTVFFETWQKAGLPYHDDFLAEYVETRYTVEFNNVWIKRPYKSSPAIEENLLRSIYGFGYVLGKVFSALLKLNETESKKASDWCGRFNLGISLFDYLSDETAGGVNRVSSLKIFQPFTKEEISEAYALTPEEEVLSNLTKSILSDLDNTVVKKQGSQKTDQLFKLMKQLYEAQNFLSKEGLSAQADLNKIKKSLYRKSAEPFRMMAEYTARTADRNDPLLIENARSLGKAIGYCYWIIDDAKDVWMDLEAGQWNLFLQIAASEDPLIFKKKSDASRDDYLQGIWKQSKHAEKLSAQIVESLVRSTEVLEATDEVKKHTLGLIAASLWQWHSY